MALQLSESFIEKLKQSGEVNQTITFYARQSGVIDALQIREGFYVKPGTTLMSIAQLDEIWVEADVFERDAMAITEGLPVIMQLDFLPGKWQGKVDYIYPSLNEKREHCAFGSGLTIAMASLSPICLRKFPLRPSP